MPAVWPLTGRAEEFAAVLTHARGRGVMLAGAAGVGKTRLAREALVDARRAAREWRYVAATATARSVPLGAFADYATRLREDPLARVGDVVEAVTRSRSGPALIVIDDAHLLDEQSALVAYQIVRRRLATVVLTVRSGEPVPDAITTLWKDQLLPRLDVQPLSRPETANLLEAVLGGPVESASADRMWHYTRGNVLYLRQLLTDELDTGHLVQRAGVWMWDAAPAVSASLAELIDTNIGRQPERVLDVLDVLAVADPLDLDILTAVTDDAAVEEAETANLVTIDTKSAPPLARLAHPMYGEVRRNRAPALRLRRLRSAVVAASPPLVEEQLDDVRLVRRAILLIDSDTTPDPTMMIDAADAASRLLDPVTAERIARHAVEHGGGKPAQWRLMTALGNSNRVGEALTLNGDLLDTVATDAERVQLTLFRAGALTREGSVVKPRNNSTSTSRSWHAQPASRGTSIASWRLCGRGSRNRGPRWTPPLLD